MRRRVFTLWLFCLLCLPALQRHAEAQTMVSLLHHLKSVRGMIDSQFQSGDRDMLDSINEALLDYLAETLPRIPGSLTDSVPNSESVLVDGLQVTSSSDHKVRFWNWDTRLGGEMPRINQVIEFQTPRGVRTTFPPIDTLDNDGLADNHWCERIFSITSTGGTRYYIAYEPWIGDRVMTGEWITAFAIRDSVLDFDTKLFKTSKRILNKINLVYPEEEVFEERQAHRISLHNSNRVLLIPLIGKNDHMTSRHLRYEFDGEHYVYTGVE